MDEAFIFVSDVHLGSAICNQKEFCCFLERIHGLATEPKIIKYKNEEVTIKNTTKIMVLLQK